MSLSRLFFLGGGIATLYYSDLVLYKVGVGTATRFSSNARN